MNDQRDLGVATFGVWTRRAACAVLTEGEVDGRVRRGEWQVPWPGVYADAGFVLSPVQRAVAAVLASGGDLEPETCEGSESGGGRRVRFQALAAARSAARVWEFPLVDDDDPATNRYEHREDDVVVWSRARPLRHHDDAGQVRTLHRRRACYGPGDLVRHPCGLWLPSPARTLYDLTAVLLDDALVCAMDDALHRELVTEPDLAAAVARHRGWRHAPRFAAAVAVADGRAESPGETLTRLLLLPHLPGLQPQVEVFDEAARLLAALDLADERLMLAVEFDGRQGHEGELMVAKDRRRDGGTGARGWTTERITWFDVRCRADQTRRRVLATAARLGRRQRATG